MSNRRKHNLTFLIECLLGTIILLCLIYSMELKEYLIGNYGNWGGLVIVIFIFLICFASQLCRTTCKECMARAEREKEICPR